MLRLRAGIIWVLRAAMRCGRDCAVPTDFLCGAASAGAASAPAAARQLIQTNRFVFTFFPPFYLFISQVAKPERHSVFATTIVSPKPLKQSLRTEVFRIKGAIGCLHSLFIRSSFYNTSSIELGFDSCWSACAHGHYDRRSIDMQRAAALIIALFAVQQLHAAPSERSVSPSRQFIIYGADAEMRGAISNLAERTKTNLLVILKQSDNWKTPLVVNLQPQQANLPEVPPAGLRFSQTGFGLKLQLDLTISHDIDVSLIERELLRAILLEIIYRKQSHIAAGTAFVEPPDWLLDGVLALTPGRDRRSLLEALADTERLMPLEKFLSQRREVMDSAGRILYRAYSLALVQLLSDESADHSSLTNYIADLATGPNEPLANLKAHFPFLAGNAEKTWQFTLGRFRNFETNDFFTFSESNRRLEGLLRVKISERNKPEKLESLAELSRRRLSASEKIALNQLNCDFLLFVAQCNPVLRPIAREYQQIAALLSRNKRRGLLKRLSRLDATRDQLGARMSDIDDYMNWFEATQMKSGSGNFTDYRKSADQSPVSTSNRRDPLTLYVDALEQQLENQ